MVAISDQFAGLRPVRSLLEKASLETHGLNHDKKLFNSGIRGWLRRCFWALIVYCIFYMSPGSASVFFFPPSCRPFFLFRYYTLSQTRLPCPRKLPM